MKITNESSPLNYTTQVAPLFKLPVDLPPSPWAGHVPFMFVLFQALKPKCYVELGVHNGCSFLAAASAAVLYSPLCRLIGVDTWQGDDHAVYGGGDAILAKLTETAETHFSNVTFVRDFFDNHALNVADRSIDLLHIDGLHTYA
jgi:Methyltransferase domain